MFRGSVQQRPTYATRLRNKQHTIRMQQSATDIQHRTRLSRLHLTVGQLVASPLKPPPWPRLGDMLRAAAPTHEAYHSTYITTARAQQSQLPHINLLEQFSRADAAPVSSRP